MGVGGQRHAPTALPPGKTRYPLYRRMGGLKSLSRRVRKMSPKSGFDPQTVQPLASRYTDCAVLAHMSAPYIVQLFYLNRILVLGFCDRAS